MTKKEALKQFILMREGRPWGDYWAMQEMWSYDVDGLNKDGVITDRQAQSWNNPTTPEKFCGGPESILGRTAFKRRYNHGKN